MEQSEQSFYSNDEEYFLDLCRAGELEELKEFIGRLGQTSDFDYSCLTNSHDNFLHMIAANNLPELFDYLYPLVLQKIGSKGWQTLINKQNSTCNTPLHYAVITNSKEMVLRLVKNGANTNLANDSGRTPFVEAEEFDKIEIAQILAPITNNNLEELKKEVDILEVCNEDSDDEQEPEKKQSKEEPQVSSKQQKKSQ